VSLKLDPGPHPDADQLSIFAEGVATPSERERLLAHFSECKECREIVFLMHPQAEAPFIPKAVPKTWLWNKWLLQASLGATAVAALTVLLYVQPWKRGPEFVAQNVPVARPQIDSDGKATVPASNSVPPAQHEEVKNGPVSGRAATNAVREQPESTADLKSAAAANPPSSAIAAAQGTGASAPSAPVPAAAGADAAPKVNVQGAADSSVVQDLPLNGRNFSSLTQQGTQTGGSAQTQNDSAQTQQSLPALQVQRSTRQIEPGSGVSGHVTDATGAGITGATVTLRGASGSTRQITTGTDGSFQLTEIPAGRYDLTVTAPGFATNHQSLDLKPSELALLQPRLGVGPVTQSMEVTASAPIVETDSASLASVASLPSSLPVAASVSLGKRILSLDGLGGLFLSGDAGKSWKKVPSKWNGKVVGIDLTAEASQAKDKGQASSAASPPSIFRLTTDTGAQWTSKDGTHWRPQ
jgi:hypothetical protein